MAEQKIRDLDTDIRVSILETQVNALENSIEKIERKIDDNYSVLHTRINELDAAFEIKNEKILKKIDDHSAASASHNREVMDKIEKIEKWKWMIMGGALVAGYVLAHIRMENLF